MTEILALHFSFIYAVIFFALVFETSYRVFALFPRKRPLTSDRYITVSGHILLSEAKQTFVNPPKSFEYKALS
jgi:hypothetical protein